MTVIKNPELKRILVCFFVGFKEADLERQAILLREVTDTPLKSAYKINPEICMSPLKMSDCKRIESSDSPQRFSTEKIKKLNEELCEN